MPELAFGQTPTDQRRKIRLIGKAFKRLLGGLLIHGQLLLWVARYAQPKLIVTVQTIAPYTASWTHHTAQTLPPGKPTTVNA